MYRTWANPEGGTSEIRTSWPLLADELAQLPRERGERDDLGFESDPPKGLGRHDRDGVVGVVVGCDAQRLHGRPRRWEAD